MIFSEEHASPVGAPAALETAPVNLSIIYVNWNSVEFLRRSIASVYRHTKDTSFEIIVVDNASPEIGIDSVKQQFPQILLLKSPSNLGFAGGNNLGFRHSRGDYLLLLNPDTELCEPSIDVLMQRILRLPDAGIVGCKLLNSDGSVQLSSIQKFPTILNQALDAEYLQLRWPRCPLWQTASLFAAGAGLIRAEAISGACMLLRRHVFEQVGLMSEDYFMYAEDIDLSYKVRRAGFVNYYVGQTAILHHGGRSSAKQSVSNWATIMKYRAMVKLFQNTRGRFYAGAYRAAMGSVAAGRLILLAVAVPFSRVFEQHERVKLAFSKWKAVLGWAVGWRAFAAEK